MTIAVTGASGQLGHLVIEQLMSRAPRETIVALARSPQKVADFRVEVRKFDYSKPDGLAAALTGVETLLLISSSEVGKRSMQHQNVIDAAVEAGVARIVYTSILRADTTDNPLAEEHKTTEAAIQASGIPFTILRNGWYCENYESAVAASLEHGTVIGSARDGRISAAARIDYAEAAAIVVTQSGRENKIHELAGDTSFSMYDFAEELSRQSGRTIPYTDLPEADYAEALLDAGLPEPFARLLARTDVTAAGGSLFDDTRQLSALIGRPTTPISKTIESRLA
ncbi:SDR family oxidoreductase [Nisaea acidiphila]|uniref:SDR family oxidoreductase n=1 Tax=Nisaea acidiphila TaxID=1862145 RepID=A0A9J7AUM7_9PROT|nr:SDR family oxidoreductase [Nisaea acidiphila]UUX49109.1 SDR family oxidoreductase [Nisaea acidiphila]